ncbi:hypothetical protein [Thermococcus camini]|uniref:Uncharacterized protein n=1 Tax=Thermococcus camini TaxID=2016373 RepID=A0A7G2D8L9_9EURY|nr:hypothetical protein [Thermococcus camini]CAD5244553.1 conserved membrane protein of unknown function [Thermococcus camini]
MIALALGLIVCLGTALVLGKLKGRSYELTMALNVPLLTYLIADGLYGDWKGIGNVFFSTPLGDFTPSEMIGIQTFLAVLIIVAHLGLRGRNSLTVDEFSSIPPMFWVDFGTGIALASSALPVLALPGLVLYLALALLSEKNPLGWLSAEPCHGELGEFAVELGLKCLTDEESLSIYRLKGHIIVGGKARRDFPRWREVVKCLSELPETGRFRLLPYLVGLIPLPVGIILGEGFVTALILVPLMLLLYLGTLIATVRRTRSLLPESCWEVMDEYVEFVRRNQKGKGGFVIG